MRHASKTGINISAQKNSPVMATMVIFLLCGIVLGCLSGKYINADSGGFLGEYLKNYEDISHTGAAGYSFGKTLFNLVKYPALIFIFSFSAIGIFCIPCIVFLKGLFSAISVSAVISSVGSKGILVALSMFGLQTFITFPCILIISSLAFEFSKVFFEVLRQNSPSRAVYPISLRGYIILFLICVCALVICALADTVITPFFVNLSINVVK